jgi:hypothetical protein
MCLYDAGLAKCILVGEATQFRDTAYFVVRHSKFAAKLESDHERMYATKLGMFILTRILPLVLYGCETWSLILREENIRTEEG